MAGRKASTGVGGAIRALQLLQRQIAAVSAAAVFLSLSTESNLTYLLASGTEYEWLRLRLATLNPT